MRNVVAYFKGAKASWLWLLLRLYVGYDWLTTGWEKITGKTPFSTSAYLKGAAAKSVGASPTVRPWWGSFLNRFAIPHAGLFDVLVPYGELLVGAALMIGFATTFALLMAMVMNFAYLLSGSISTNPQMLILEMTLLGIGGGYVGYLGVDYWFRPHYRKVAGLEPIEARPAAKKSHRRK